jgi:hypothetical protein
MEAFWDYKGAGRHMLWFYKCFYDVGPRLAKVDPLKEQVLNSIPMRFNEHELDIHYPFYYGRISLCYKCHNQR